MSSGSCIKPKRIHVFVNGNPSERIFFIHPKCRLSWSSIINFIGDLLKPQNGPIRVLRRVDGSSVLEYEDLEDNGKYVACGREPLVPLLEGYRTESELDLGKRNLRETSSSEIIKAIGSDIKYLTDTNQMKIITIYVFRNGQNKTKPSKVSLLNTDLGQWTTVLSVISKEMNQDVDYLYTIFGEKLRDPSEIQHRGFYVALSADIEFNDISYLSVFSPKRQRKVRFKQTTQQTSSKTFLMVDEDKLPHEAAKNERLTLKPPMELTSTSSPNESSLFCSRDTISVNDPTSDSPCVHITIVQRPFSASRHFPGIPSTVCASKPSAKLVLEMIGEREYDTKCQMCKETQTSTIFCEAAPKGKCVIEVASKKFHIICDDDAIVLPCGTYFSSHKSMKKPCTFPAGNESLSLENIANHIVGIVVDNSEYCVTRAIYGLENPVCDSLGMEFKETKKKEHTDGLENELTGVKQNIEHEVPT